MTLLSSRRSPILDLEQAIAGAAFNIAPERANELANDRTLEKFSLAISDESGFRIRVNTVTHEATLPIATLEYIWCCAYLYWTIYQSYLTAQGQGQDTLDLRACPQACVAIELFNWAKLNLKKPNAKPWPEGPRPNDSLEQASDIHVADELFLAGLAWIIHHEIAHVRLEHGQAYAGMSVQQEKECDLSATNWITSKCSSPREIQKRHLGLIVALMAMQYLDEPEGTDSYVGSHPPTVERLDYCLDAAGATDDSVVCAFASVALQLQLDQLEIAHELDGASIRDILASFQVAFRTSGR